MQGFGRILFRRRVRREPGGSDYRSHPDHPRQRETPRSQRNFSHANKHVERRDRFGHRAYQNARQNYSADEPEEGPDRAENDRFAQEQEPDFVSGHA